MPPRTTPSTRSSCCEESFLPSGRPGTGMRHTASDGVSGAGRLAHVHIADTGNPPASDTRPDTPGRPPPSRTDAETRAGLQERAAGAPAYAISGGLLKQPDKHEWANGVLLTRRPQGAEVSGEPENHENNENERDSNRPRPACPWRGHAADSTAASVISRSRTVQTRSVNPASIAGVTRSV